MSKKKSNKKSTKTKVKASARKAVPKKAPTKKAASKKATTKKIPAKQTSPKKASAKKASSKTTSPTTSSGAKKAAVRKSAEENRRKHRRHNTNNLWVTELSGDYQFVVAAGDISEGGIFLKSRMKTSPSPSELLIPMGTAMGTMQVTAKPVYDRLTKETYGTGYEFAELSAAQMKSLRGFLRNLD